MSTQSNTELSRRRRRLVRRIHRFAKRPGKKEFLIAGVEADVARRLRDQKRMEELRERMRVHGETFVMPYRVQDLTPAEQDELDELWARKGLLWQGEMPSSAKCFVLTVYHDAHATISDRIVPVSPAIVPRDAREEVEHWLGRILWRYTGYVKQVKDGDKLSNEGEIEQLEEIAEELERMHRDDADGANPGNTTRPVAPTSKREPLDGYVRSPEDPAAYAPMTDILAKHTPPDLAISMKELGTILEDCYTNRVRWTRPLGKNGRPVPNRRSVHLGDWAAYLKRRTNPESDGFPRLSETELERRKAAVRDARHAGK